MKNKRIILMAALMTALWHLGNVPVAAAGYGSIVPSDAVTQAFAKSQADPGVIYYHSGSDVWPDAIIGVYKAYKLGNSLWHKCGTAAVLTNHISGMQAAASDLRISLQGFAILDDRGNEVGVWYSPLDTPTFVRKVSETAVDIHTPLYQGRLNSILNSN